MPSIAGQDVGLAAAEPASRPTRRDVVRVRHYGRGLLAVLVAALVVFAGYNFATNKNIEWSVVRQYLFDHDILRGLWTTIEITLIGMAISIVGALVVALMRISKSLVLRWVAAGWIFVFRGVPIILLLIFIGNLGLFVKKVQLGIPFTGITFFSKPSSELLTPFVASIIGLSLAGSGYMAEIVRAGLLAIGKGQHDAAKALGLTSLQTTRHIVLPQALRVIVPPMGNEMIGMLKATAIVSVIGGGDVLTVAQSISGSNYRTIEMLLVAAFWYFVVIVVMSVFQHVLERRLAER
jgi:polar amino acid transport system permease protein